MSKIAPIERSAFTTLKTEMLSVDFNKLNWNDVTIFHLNNKETLIKINSLIDTSKFLLYGEKDGIKYFNWVQINLNYKNRETSGIINIISIRNVLKKSYNISNNKIVEVPYTSSKSTLSIQDFKMTKPNVATDGYNLDPVTVTAYYFSSNTIYSFNYTSCYYLFGSVSSWEGLYMPTNNTNNLGSASNDIIDLSNLPLYTEPTAKIERISSSQRLVTIKDSYGLYTYTFTFVVDNNNILVPNTQTMKMTGFSVLTYIQDTNQIPQQLSPTGGFVDFTLQVTISFLYKNSILSMEWDTRINVNMNTGAAKIFYHWSNQ